MARRSHLEGRLLAILDRKRNRRPLTLPGTLVAAALAVSVAAVVASVRAAGPANSSESGSGAADGTPAPAEAKRAAELLRAFKAAENDGTQAEVARKLVALGDKSVVPDLVEMLTSEDRRARCNAGWVLAALGDARGLAAVLAELKDTGQRPTKMIRSDGKPNVPGQVRSDRYYAAHVLGEIGDRRAVPALKETLKSDDPNERLWAGHALGKLNDPAGVPAVAAFLKDPQWTQRRHAAESLGDSADKRAVAPLIEALKDEQPEVRVSAARALGRIGDESAAAALETLLKDDAVTTSGRPVAVRDAAAEAIRRIRGAAKSPARTAFGPATAGSLGIVKPDAPTHMLLVKRPLLCLGRGYSRYVTDVKDVSKQEDGRLMVTAEGIDLAFRPGARWELLIDPDAAHMVRSAKMVDEKNRTTSIVNSGLKRFGPRCVPEKAQCKGAFIDASFEMESASSEADVEFLRRAKAAMRPPYLVHMDVHDERASPELYVPYNAGKASPRGRRQDWDIGL